MKITNYYITFVTASSRLEPNQWSFVKNVVAAKAFEKQNRADKNTYEELMEEAFDGFDN